jgi:hypothetical protein
MTDRWKHTDGGSRRWWHYDPDRRRAALAALTVRSERSADSPRVVEAERSSAGE